MTENCLSEKNTESCIKVSIRTNALILSPFQPIYKAGLEWNRQTSLNIEEG